MTTWSERLQHDETLQAFVRGEIARAGIELDTLRYQRARHRAQLAALEQELAEARTELRALRRRVGRLEDVS
jgi:hypothetical protein